MRSDKTTTDQIWTGSAILPDFRKMDAAALEQWADTRRRRVILHVDRKHRLTFEDVSGDLLHSWNLAAPGSPTLEDADPGGDAVKLEPRSYREKRRGRAPGPLRIDTRHRADIQRLNAASQMRGGRAGAVLGGVQMALEMAQKYVNRRAIIAELERLAPELVRELRGTGDLLAGALVVVSYQTTAIAVIHAYVTGTARILKYALADYQARIAGGTISAPDTCIRLVWVERMHY